MDEYPDINYEAVEILKMFNDDINLVIVEILKMFESECFNTEYERIELSFCKTTSKRINWLNNLCVFDDLLVPKLYAWLATPSEKDPDYWTLEKCIKSSLEFNNLYDWKYFKKRAYESATMNDWIYKCCVHMEGFRKPIDYWTFELCMQSASKFDSRGKWKVTDSGAYISAKRNGWLDLCLPLNLTIAEFIASKQVEAGQQHNVDFVSFNDELINAFINELDTLEPHKHNDPLYAVQDLKAAWRCGLRYERDEVWSFEQMTKIESNLSYVEVLFSERLNLINVRNADPLKSIEYDQFKSLVNSLLKSLTTREQSILKLRLGMDSGVLLTYEDIGEIFNLSGGRILQIYDSSLRKLRNPFFHAREAYEIMLEF